MNNEKMQSFFTKVYLWMFIGLLVSGTIAYITSINTSLLSILSSSYLFVIIAEILVVIALTALIKKVSPTVAKILFLLYSALNGFTLASIFMVYKLDSIVMVFIASAVLFGVLAFYGYTTKNDLTKFGKILFAGLIAIIVMSIVNIFVGGNAFGIAIAMISVVLFLGLTAYDMQKLRRIYYSYENDQDMVDKVAIYGALDLYLDFINIFIELLRIFGNRRD